MYPPPLLSRGGNMKKVQVKRKTTLKKTEGKEEKMKMTPLSHDTRSYTKLNFNYTTELWLSAINDRAESRLAVFSAF